MIAMDKKNKSQPEKKLRTGFTTGTAAAAAAKGAMSLLLSGKAPPDVRIMLLTGESLCIPLHTCKLAGEGTAVCTVIKDAGDDPDITHRAEIGAKVTLLEDSDGKGVNITGGKGVGRVTKPGLEIPPGEPAINPGPRKMITHAVRQMLETGNAESQNVAVEIFVPAGEHLARKTLNARLGILGGISILGTTGLVRPMSHEAYIATIESSMSVARAMGIEQVVLTTGRRSERYAQNLWEQLPEEAFIQVGDFFKSSLDAASDRGFKTVTLAVFFGKAVKMAQGVPHTHAAKSSLTLNRLSQWAYDLTGDQDMAQSILDANTARHAFDLIADKYPAIISHVGEKMIQSARGFAGQEVYVNGVIFDYTGHVVFDVLG